MATAGRPRSFDKDEALKKAMYVFWEKGYEGTTMADLIEAIGMKAPSIYAAFGNKDAVFKEVVLQYLPIVATGQLAILNSIPDIQEAVESTLNECVRIFSGESNPGTCLIMTAAINVSPGHQEQHALLKSMRNEYQNNWHARFVRAKDAGQLKNELAPEALAAYFMSLIQGMALAAKDGMGKEHLSAITKIGMRIFN